MEITMFNKLKIFEGVANITKDTIWELSRHKEAKKHPQRYAGTYFPKAAGKLSPQIVFRFYDELDDGTVRTCESGAFTGPCMILMIRRVHPNQKPFYTVDVTKRKGELTDWFVEVVDGPSQFNHSITSEVLCGLDVAGHRSVQIIQK
jgi:hypothetical protein